jgi:integrase
MSVRFRHRTDGSVYTQVRFRMNGKQTSVSFNDHAEAVQFDELLTKVGPEKALEITRIVIHNERGLTMTQWLNQYIDNLTGIEPETAKKYRSYVANDLGVLADIPLVALTPDDMSGWVNGMRNRNGSIPSGKTVANKHGFVAGALNAAVQRGHIKFNPCEHVRLPRWDREEMVFLEPAEYHILRDATPQYWRPLLEFLVSSGARWSEATALQPKHVDRRAGTVRIVKAWKKAAEGGYALGVPKTKMSVRTINMPADVLDQLDYSGQWLFTNSGKGRHNEDGVVRIHSFAPNVWHPAVNRAREAGLTKRPRVHDLRHTCASWLIQAGRPLPAIQQQLGHESIITTVGTYGHLDRESGQDNADVLAAMLKRYPH